jgi:hypothetical protein
LQLTGDLCAAPAAPHHRDALAGHRRALPGNSYREGVMVVKVLAVAIAAIGISVLAVVGGVALESGAWPAGPDAFGFAAATAVGGALLVGAVHWPVLARLRRGAGRRLTPGRAALIAALGLNAPVYAALALLGRNRALFAAGEAVLLGVGVALIGLIFGAGYARAQRDAAV